MTETCANVGEKSFDMAAAESYSRAHVRGEKGGWPCVVDTGFVRVVFEALCWRGRWPSRWA
jgi:hypothetical protein